MFAFTEHGVALIILLFVQMTRKSFLRVSWTCPWCVQNLHIPGNMGAYRPEGHRASCKTIGTEGLQRWIFGLELLYLLWKDVWSFESAGNEIRS